MAVSLGQQARQALPSVRILYYSCARTAHTHTKTFRCMRKKHTLVCTFSHSHTHKPSSGVNEALEFLKAPPVRDRLCFIHPLISPFFPHSSPPRVNFAFGHSSSLPPFTWLSLLRSELDLNPLLGTHTEEHKNNTGMQLDTVHLKRVSTSFIISDHHIAWCVWVQDVRLGLHLGVCMFWCVLHHYPSSY